MRESTIFCLLFLSFVTSVLLSFFIFLASPLILLILLILLLFIKNLNSDKLKLKQFLKLETRCAVRVLLRDFYCFLDLESGKCLIVGVDIAMCNCSKTIFIVRHIA